MALNNTISIKRNTEIEAAKLISSESKSAPEKAKLTDDVMITAMRQVKSFAISNHLPVQVTQEKNLIKITPIVSENGAESTKAAILERYPEIISFFKDISVMPSLNMQFTSYCLGEDCNNGLDVTIEVKGI